MLVLQRRVGESICIGQDIEVVVLQVSGGRTRLGFRCPVDVPIRRRELPAQSGSSAVTVGERVGSGAAPAADS